MGATKQMLYCSFCGKSEAEVRKLVAGPCVYICNECAELIADIMKDDTISGAMRKGPLIDNEKEPAMGEPSKIDELEEAAVAEAIAALEEARQWIKNPVTDYTGRATIAKLTAALTSLRAVAPAPADDTFQSRVKPWMYVCFGRVISADKIERNHRFLEEALELVQACGCSQNEAHQLVDYVYGRDQGDINQEVGGVMVTLAALCLANGFDMHAAAETELARVWTKIDKIRAKQAAKPKHSPLPTAPADQSDAGRIERVAEVLKNRLPFVIAGEDMRDLARVVVALSKPESDAERDGVVEEAKDDLVSHRSSWRAALEKAWSRAITDNDDANETYWAHELAAFDRTFSAIASAPSETVGRMPLRSSLMEDESEACELREIAGRDGGNQDG